jgi:hypothetical protein
MNIITPAASFVPPLHHGIRRTPLNRFGIVLGLCLGLAACGGGGGDSSSPPAPSNNWDSMRWDQGKWG